MTIFCFIFFFTFFFSLFLAFYFFLLKQTSHTHAPKIQGKQGLQSTVGEDSGDTSTPQTTQQGAPACEEPTTLLSPPPLPPQPPPTLSPPQPPPPLGDDGDAEYLRPQTRQAHGLASAPLMGSHENAQRGA